jgi:hypothetical protein
MLARPRGISRLLAPQHRLPNHRRARLHRVLVRRPQPPARRLTTHKLPRPLRRLPRRARRPPAMAGHGPRHAARHLSLAPPTFGPALPRLHRHLPARPPPPARQPRRRDRLGRRAGARPLDHGDADPVRQQAPDRGERCRPRDRHPRPSPARRPADPERRSGLPAAPPARPSIHRNPARQSVPRLRRPHRPELDARLRALDTLTFRRQGALVELEWAYADLRTWAQARHPALAEASA